MTVPTEAIEAACEAFVRHLIGEDFLSGMTAFEQEEMIVPRKAEWRPAVALILAAAEAALSPNREALKLENDAYVWEVAHLRTERDGLRELLRQAQPTVCSMLCPSTKHGDFSWVHTDLCKAIRSRTGQPPE